NLLGQLGDGTQTARPTPVEVQRRIAPDLTYPIVNVTSITAGYDHTCMRSAGEVWCTGRNDSGQLGRDITPYLELLGVQTSPVVLASEVAAGAQHTCARLTTGRVICFGADDYGQVGTAARCPAQPTVAITGITSPTLISSFPLRFGKVLERQSGALVYT